MLLYAYECFPCMLNCAPYVNLVPTPVKIRHQIPLELGLQVLVSHHCSCWQQTWVLCKNSDAPKH